MSDYVIIAGTPLPREPAVYHTAPWRTQTATSGDCRREDGRAKPDQSRNAADTYPVEIEGQRSSPCWILLMQVFASCQQYILTEVSFNLHILASNLNIKKENKENRKWWWKIFILFYLYFTLDRCNGMRVCGCVRMCVSGECEYV